MKMTKEDRWQTNVVSTENMSCMKFRPDCSLSSPDMYNKWSTQSGKRMLNGSHSKRTCHMMNGRDLMQIATLELILKVLHIIFGNHQLLASKKVLKRNITRLTYLIQFTEVTKKICNLQKGNNLTYSKRINCILYIAEINTQCFRWCEPRKPTTLQEETTHKVF